MTIRMADGFEAEIGIAKIIKRFPDFEKLARHADARNYLVAKSERMSAVVIIGDQLFRYDGPVRKAELLRACYAVS